MEHGNAGEGRAGERAVIDAHEKLRSVDPDGDRLTCSPGRRPANL